MIDIRNSSTECTHDGMMFTKFRNTAVRAVNLEKYEDL